MAIPVTLVQSGGTTATNITPAKLAAARYAAPADRPPLAPQQVPCAIAPGELAYASGTAVWMSSGTTPVPGTMTSFTPMSAPAEGFAPASATGLQSDQARRLVAPPAVAPSPGPGRWPVSTER